MTPSLLCPRCHREQTRSASFCAGCGAPLMLGDDAVRPLEMALDLDRRTRRGPEAPAGDPAPRAPAVSTPPLGGADLAEQAAGGSEWDVSSVLDLSFTMPGREPRGAAAAALAAPAPLLDHAPEPDAIEAATLRGDGGLAPEADPLEMRGATPDDDARAPEALEIHVERPEPWRRAAAWGVDVVPFVVAGAALARKLLRDAGAALPASFAEPDLVLDFLARERVITLSIAGAVALSLAVYVTVGHALAGATLGKWLLRVRVIGPDGAMPSPARSGVRSLVALASAGLLGLGLLLALFTRSGRGLHDFIARTWVVKAP